ncbi:hypothetical protein EMMF5_005399 [Cystobasidiomycetes sp. EMM_F5]
MGDPVLDPLRALRRTADTLFGRTKTPAEQLRQHQRLLQRSQRELDRERAKLEQQEKKLGGSETPSTAVIER